MRVVARKYSSALYNSPASYEHKSPLLKHIRNTVFSSKLLELQLSSVNGVSDWAKDRKVESIIYLENINNNNAAC